jgi:hypothetical protein
MPQEWTPQWAARSPMFEPLGGYAAQLAGGRWPSLAELQALFDAAGVVNERGPARRGGPRGPRRGDYESRIHLDGELQVRPANWHDFFNALAWLAFPRAKAALNGRHCREQAKRRAAGAVNRGPVQDALTLFDEGGVAVVSSAADLLALLKEFAWKELFWRNRARVMRHMRFVVFGHALHEKALAPFRGITGRGLLFEVEAGFHALPLAESNARLDAMIAAVVKDPRRLLSTRELAPVPVLGVPGWCEDNARESYYDDDGYFRPGRGARGETNPQSPL